MGDPTTPGAPNSSGSYAVTFNGIIAETWSPSLQVTVLGDQCYNQR